MTSPADIEKVLTDMRAAVRAGKIQLIPRKKNMNTLARLGITWSDAKEAICELSAGNHFQGPEADRDFPGTDPLWMFKKSIEGQVIYIKFKVLYLKDGSVKLISFHIDES